MKFIGQYIENFIARFRNDVYFESVENGDSDTDKFLIIGASGKLKYRTGTEVLSDIGAGVGDGDITSVSITTDSGSGSRASDASGIADFSLLGTSGVGVTNSGTTITVTSVPGEIDHDSLLNFAAGEHFTQANITTVGTITTGTWRGTAIEHDSIGGDAIDGDNIADDSINSEHYVDGSIDTAHIADDQVTFAKASGVTPKVFGSVIKLIPSDFMDNGDGGNTKFGVAYTDVAGTGYGMRPPNNATELYAFVSIPEGMKATHVDIFDKNDLAIEVFEAHINATTMTSKGSGNCNTTLDITDVNSSATNFLAIEVTTTSVNDRIYGGTVTIAAQ